MPILDETAVCAADHDGEDLGWPWPNHLADWPRLTVRLTRWVMKSAATASTQIGCPLSVLRFLTQQP